MIPPPKSLASSARVSAHSHLQFGWGENRMLYFSGGGDVIGFINTRTWDRTQDEQLSQGWCPMVVDTNGDGRISKPWNQPVGAMRSQNEGGGGGRLIDVDLTLDTRMSPGSYGIIADTQVEGVAWGVGTEFPGRILPSRHRRQPARDLHH